MTLICQHCGKPTTVPTSTGTDGVGNDPADQSSEKLAELQSRIKENESQRTEVAGYINQLNIQLHRWQLRLQMLDDRKKELNDELAELRSAADSDEA
jgi:uncharacterized coiled-coil DUF342 family protein